MGLVAFDDLQNVFKCIIRQAIASCEWPSGADHLKHLALLLVMTILQVRLRVQTTWLFVTEDRFMNSVDVKTWIWCIKALDYNNFALEQRILRHFAQVEFELGHILAARIVSNIHQSDWVRAYFTFFSRKINDSAAHSSAFLDGCSKFFKTLWVKLLLKQILKSIEITMKMLSSVLDRQVEEIVRLKHCGFWSNSYLSLGIVNSRYSSYLII